MSDLRFTGDEMEGGAKLLASARARLCAAAADLALPHSLRLTEWQRTTLQVLLAGLVRAVEDELRAALAQMAAEDALHAALSSAHVEIAMPVLAGQPALAEPGLIAILLRRVEEHRLHRAAGADNILLIELAGDQDEDVAREAMALLIAQNGRLDGFHDPVLPRGDLPAEIEHHLVWTVAAALRRYMITRHAADPATCDAALSAAAARLLCDHDEGETAQARALRLAAALSAAERLEEEGLALRALGEGSLPLFLAVAGLRAGVDADAAWDLFSAGNGEGAVLLLRAAGITRAEAAGLLLALGDDEETLGRSLDRFDVTPPEGARARLALWRADPAYRAAVGSLAA
ncbi:MAG TPA: DUF2336 domain-containing protein [Allosphingosinicella sp.]|nr:DUF2336 domain-containing protein [Allosphingosinicella sp.]